ncbi:ATP-dependent DNA helicase [Nocardia sp. BMG111209]|uniref:ATP-dependent helicase n=1 Tax=Nocardia sp. BMG111209 TaxID=1160137 RepID=UPI0012DC5526|nr:ATP-dependent DNA helicase [Nocardia sp. BMG111209]
MRRSETAPHSREWGADVRPLFDHSAAEPGWRPWQVLGAPGTGKTSLLVDLAAQRIAGGADPESVLVLTHAKQAALRVRTALTRQLGEVPGAVREPLVRTVHSYAFAILRGHAATHGNPPPRLLTGTEQDVVLREMLRGELLDIAAGAEDLWPQRLHPALGTTGFAEQLRDLMLRATERGLGPEDLIDLGHRHDRPEWSAAGRFAERYEQAMLLRWSVGLDAPEASAPALDAAELVGAALDALIQDPDLLAAERGRIHCLLVDDAQHLDPLAAQLVRAIGAGPATTVVAGDPDQSVFTFRGSDVRFLLDPDAPTDRRLVLPDTRRSAPDVRAAVARITARLPGAGPHRLDLRRVPPDRDPSRRETRSETTGDSVWPGDSSAGEQLPPRDALDASPGEVRVQVLTTPAKEAALIADHLRRAHLTDGVPWSEMAVLVRSVPLSLAPLRRALLAAGVPVLQPKPDVPLARRRGAGWLLLTLRALLAAEEAERHPGRTPKFTEEDALDLLSGPLGGADQISLRRLRRGIRRTLVERGNRRGGEQDPRTADHTGDWDGTESTAPNVPGRQDDTGSIADITGPDAAGEQAGAADPDTAAVVPETVVIRSDTAGAGQSHAGEFDARDPDGRSADPETEDAVPQRIRRGDPASGSRIDDDFDPLAGDFDAPPDVDRSSAEVLRDLMIGVGDTTVLDRLTEVEAAPLRRVLKAVRRGQRARERGAGLEDVLWAVWTASQLEQRWVRQSARGGAAGMQADRDLDAVVGLFDAAAAHVDRLPHATIEGFVDYLQQQEIPQDSAPLTDPGAAVAVLSAHAAVGREWEVVVVAGVQEGIWPNLRPRGTLLGVEDLVDLLAGVVDSGERVSRAAPILAEERRLLLVACSRARRSLLVTAVESVTGERDLVPSRFLAELDPDAAPGEPGRVPPPVDPGRALVLQALIAELRGVACDSDEVSQRRERAARQLARLARAGVRGAHPDHWYGTAELSSQLPLWGDDEGPVSLSPSTVELLQTCPLRWALERHGGGDADNPHAVKGNLVHTLVQALAGQVTEAQVKAALVRAWKAVDPTSGDTGPHSWHSRLELRRTESMLDTFLDWLRNTRHELTLMGVEVPVDLVLPALDPDHHPVRIRGRVDRVERDTLGRFVIVDVKTAKTPISKQAAEDHAQLATYQVAAAAGGLDEGPAEAEPGGARLLYVAKPSTREGATQRMQPPLDPEALDRWRTTIHEAAEATRGPSYLAMRNDGCRHCTVAGSCPVQDAGRQVTDS